jgi:hypothetical protein
MKYKNFFHHPLENIGHKVELDDAKNERHGQHGTIVNADQYDGVVEYLVHFDDDTSGWFVDRKINFLY